MEIIGCGEDLGFDGAWVRHRHLQYGISSPVAVLAAASQRTSRIELGTAVIPLGWENPLRLAEDLATVDVLAGGRLNPGVTWGRRCTTTWSGRHSTRTRPSGRTSATGGASLRSARWAGEHGMNFLTSSVVKAEGEDADFAAIQLAQIRAFRAHHPDGEAARVSQGLVVIPTDSATGEQKARCHAYAEKRTPRTAAPQGPARMLFSRDYVGSAAEIAADRDGRVVDRLAGADAHQVADRLAAWER